MRLFTCLFMHRPMFIFIYLLAAISPNAIRRQFKNNTIKLLFWLYLWFKNVYWARACIFVSIAVTYISIILFTVWCDDHRYDCMWRLAIIFSTRAKKLLQSQWHRENFSQEFYLRVKYCRLENKSNMENSLNFIAIKSETNYLIEFQ